MRTGDVAVSGSPPCLNWKWQVLFCLHITPTAYIVFKDISFEMDMKPNEMICMRCKRPGHGARYCPSKTSLPSECVSILDHEKTGVSNKGIMRKSLVLLLLQKIAFKITASLAYLILHIRNTLQIIIPDHS